MHPNTSNSYTYPQSREQLNKLLDDYYQLNLQIQTLQRHILKIQTQNQQQHKYYNDEVQKLKLYIDQCENEIKKREERQLLLIERLKELQLERLDEVQSVKSDQKVNNLVDQVRRQCQVMMKAREEHWNKEKISLLEVGQSNRIANQQLKKQLTLRNNKLNSLIQQNGSLNLQIQQLKSKLASTESTIIKLRHDLEIQKDNLTKINTQNAAFETKLKEIQRKLAESNRLRLQVEQELEKQTKKSMFVAPVSVLSCCPNCLKLSRIHSVEMQKKVRQIESLRKDIECLMVFFELSS